MVANHLQENFIFFECICYLQLFKSNESSQGHFCKKFLGCKFAPEIFFLSFLDLRKRKIQVDLYMTQGQPHAAPVCCGVLTYGILIGFCFSLPPCLLLGFFSNMCIFQFLGATFFFHLAFYVVTYPLCTFLHEDILN